MGVQLVHINVWEWNHLSEAQQNRGTTVDLSIGWECLMKSRGQFVFLFLDSIVV